MVRRTLEGVCADKGVQERVLARSLEKLHADGLLDPRLLEWAQVLQVVGNEGAHFTGKQVSREDASDVLAFSEALLDYLYVLNAKFEEFKRRTSRSTQVLKRRSKTIWAQMPLSSRNDRTLHVNDES